MCRSADLRLSKSGKKTSAGCVSRMRRRSSRIGTLSGGRTLPAEVDEKIREICREGSEPSAMATRQALTKVLEATAPCMPELIGGSADLSGSCGTLHSGSRDLHPDTPDGNFIHYGVREAAMSAAISGMQLHGGVRPYSGTFPVLLGLRPTSGPPLGADGHR